MTKFVLGTLVFLLVGQAGPLNAAAPCNKLSSPPAIFYDLGLLRVEKYQNQKLGMSFTYASRDVRLSFFKYDLGYQSINDEDSKKILQQSVWDVVRYVKRMGREIKSAVHFPAFQFEGLTFQNVIMIGEGHGKIEYDIVSLSHDGSCFYKVRFSDRASTSEANSIKKYADYYPDLLRLVLKLPPDVLIKQPASYSR